MDFSRILLDHVANETKTSLEKVESTYHDWRAEQDEKDGASAYLTDEYMNKIELPRAERYRIYEEYCMEKSRLMDTWRHAPQSQKARSLIQLINFKIPDEIVYGIDNHRIYTKNVVS